jgi:hypothetical protein
MPIVIISDNTVERQVSITSSVTQIKEVHFRMPPALPGSADASNKFEDLSGVDIAAYENPYDALIDACHNDPVGSTSIFTLRVTTPALNNA